MQMLQSGQCGLCEYFGAHAEQPVIEEMRTSGRAPENVVDDCDHPKLTVLNLKVTPISGCDGFKPAKQGG